MQARSKLMSISFCAALMLSGCQEGAMSGSTAINASAPASSSIVSRGKNKQEIALERQVQDLNQVTRNIIVSNTIQGAVAGAVAGCILAELTNRRCVEGAVAGGILGGVAGNQIGQKAAKANQDLVKADETLAKLRGVQKKLGAVEVNLRQVLKSQNSEIASLRRQVSAGQVSKSAASGRIAAINSNRSAVISGLQKSEQNVAKERVELVSLEKRSGQKLGSTKKAVSSTEARIKNLRSTVRLASN
jgi:uncharacterized protein YcfJ